MSYIQVSYPQSIASVIAFGIREDGDDYNVNVNHSILELQDRIDDRLARAKALTRLLQTADSHPEQSTQVIAMVLEEHIEQAQEASGKLWERVREVVQEKK